MVENINTLVIILVKNEEEGDDVEQGIGKIDYRLFNINRFFS
jgi:hypothetical protein